MSSMSERQPCVATLVARKGQIELGEDIVGPLRGLLGSREPLVWLAPVLAADLRFEAALAELPGLRRRAARLLDSVPVDLALQPARTRRKRLFLADMDSTLIEQECIDELAEFAGLKERVAAITERAMRGEIAFEPALRERVALLEGLPVDVIATVLAERITLTPGAETLIRTLRAAGTYCALVSGGFTTFTGPIAARLGFDEHRSNRLDVADGRLTGTVADPILGRDAKLQCLVDLRTALGLSPEGAMAVGDGANDLAMLDAAGLGVAFKAKPAVAAAAAARIDHTDLTTLLYFQGYAREDFLGHSIESAT